MKVQLISPQELQVGDLFLDPEINGICQCEGQVVFDDESQVWRIPSHIVENPNEFHIEYLSTSYVKYQNDSEARTTIILKPKNHSFVKLETTLRQQ